MNTHIHVSKYNYYFSLFLIKQAYICLRLTDYKPPENVYLNYFLINVCLTFTPESRLFLTVFLGSNIGESPASLDDGTDRKDKLLLLLLRSDKGL